MNGFYSSVAGATLRWHDFPGDGLPVVFIHGLGCASSYDYPRIASDPALRERRKILIDLPGFGYSDKPRVFSYNIHEQVLVLEQFLSHLRLQRFALFGHSMGGSIAIEAAGLLGERVTTLLVSEPNLFAGGGEYSRRIAAQSETAFVADGYARLLAEERSPWAGCLQNCAPWAVWRAASSLIRGSDTPWFTQLCQLRCQKMLIVGERSLPYADSDLVQAQGIPVGIVPHAGHSMAWENPQGLAQLIASHS
ncbi:alpha/beta hydrolase [Klebsiella pneumoniae]|uniref:alpha/beta fold hydrolase n=1 Tax=Klebsiella pneumoniae TaxID=573 RepID=UPI000B41388C|nr:alpha/beta hydrolase [Klebsiella pneumoniae]RNR12191.1 alpha/beta hydrolase [Klebsiella pneumoniae]